LDAFNKNQPQPFLTFLYDPKTDAAGIPFDAQTVGDFLTTRQLYSLSYPLNAGNTFQKLNYDYPGNAPVLTAPVINGFDVSAWAQMPSGRHRLMFIERPYTDTAFAGLPVKYRKNILIDTTVNFDAGEVYTVEVVARDIDSTKYGLYIRREDFTHQHFDNDKLYLSLFNLSGAPLRKNPTAFGKQYFVSDTINMFYSCNLYNDVVNSPGTFNMMPDYTNVYLTTLSRFSTRSVFYPLPVFPNSYFYDAKGQLRTLGNYSTNQITLGTMPFYSFNAVNAQGKLLKGADNLFASMYSCADPGWINTFNQGATSSNGVDAAVTTANLYQFLTKDGRLNIYPTLNLFEMVYDRVYHIQIQQYHDGH